MRSSWEDEEGGEVRPANREDMQEFDKLRNRGVMRVMGAFSLVVAVAVVCSMYKDGQVSAKSERLLIQESSGNLRKITKSPKHAGGLKALAQFTNHLIHTTETATTFTKSKISRAALHKRLATLALSKLQNEGADVGADANSTSPSAGGDADGADDTVDENGLNPGWDAKHWTTSDWVLWTFTGPVLTMTACTFIFYAYGWPWAVGSLLVLVAVDMFGFYWNV